MVSQKHRTDARQVLVGRRLAFAEESGPDALIDGIAAALANAEREGLKRAAGIARDEAKRAKNSIIIPVAANIIADRIMIAAGEGR